VTEPAHLRDILILLLAAVAVVPLVRRLRASAVLGYLAAGALIGPHGLGLLGDVEAAAGMGELGVVFLLFSIGLSLSVERLVALRRYALGLGIAQVLATAVALWALLRTLGVPSAAALVLGGGLALSSTAVVLQMLIERRELPTAAGRVALAVLLLQDVAVVPLLTLVPLLRGGEASVLPALGMALVRAALGLAVILVLGRLALRPLLRAVARDGTPELFTGIVLLLVLGVGWLTEQVGLSMALGAFLAGMLVAETEYRHQVEADVQPFRGLLLALFFMSVGMGLDVGLLWTQAPALLGLTAALLLVKASLLAVLARGFGLGTATAVTLGLMLAQGGEFGFVLFSLARQDGLLSAEAAQLAVLAVGVGMAVTPLLIGAGRRLARRLEADREGPALAEWAEALRAHVIIAGFGRVGHTVARLLALHGTPYLALDLDAERVIDARTRRLPVFFGDASRGHVLAAAGLERAEALVVTLDEPASAHRAVRVARHLTPALPVLARARDVAHAERLVRAGATMATPEIVEGSLQLGAAVLRQLGVAPAALEQALGELRRDGYARVAGDDPDAPTSADPPGDDRR
jgi:CPA2 family monovalent cation:H+ antiporter-2